MITCGGCTAIYSDELDVCPHCGAKTPRDTSTNTGGGESELRHGELDAPVFEHELVADVGAYATHPEGVKLNDNGEPVLDEDGHPVMESEQ